MKIKYLADENIPLVVIKELSEKGFPIESIASSKRGMNDKDIMKFAFVNELVIISFDKDFGQLIFKEKVKSKGIILLRFPPTSPDKIKSIIKRILEDKEFNPFEKFVVIHEKHMRIVELP
ncbi:MAG: DUF5615 family PIN-like protein [Asgard group archaeon]|nr:DUF5615 family PIN-like protein [Asgard group archaeon]